MTISRQEEEIEPLFSKGSVVMSNQSALHFEILSVYVGPSASEPIYLAKIIGTTAFEALKQSLLEANGFKAVELVR